MSSQLVLNRNPNTLILVIVVVSYLLIRCGDPPGTSRRQSQTSLRMKSATERIERGKTFLDSISSRLPNGFRNVGTFGIDFEMQSSGMYYLYFQDTSTENEIAVTVDGSSIVQLSYLSFGPRQCDSLHKKAIELVRRRAR